MKVIKRTKKTGTYFKLIAGDDLWKFNIVQIVTPHVYENRFDYPVYLCEVEKESEE